MGSFKTCVTREKGEGRLTEKITTSDIGEVLLTQKPGDFWGDVLFE